MLLGQVLVTFFPTLRQCSLLMRSYYVFKELFTTKMSIHCKVLVELISILLMSCLHLTCHAVWLFCSLHVVKLSISLNSDLFLLTAFLTPRGAKQEIISFPFFPFCLFYPYFIWASNAVFSIVFQLLVDLIFPAFGDVLLIFFLTNSLVPFLHIFDLVFSSLTCSFL